MRAQDYQHTRKMQLVNFREYTSPESVFATARLDWQDCLAEGRLVATVPWDKWQHWNSISLRVRGVLKFFQVNNFFNLHFRTWVTGLPRKPGLPRGSTGRSMVQEIGFCRFRRQFVATDRFLLRAR